MDNLQNRSFKLLWVGNTISVFGNRIYMIGIMWYIIQATGSGLALGLSTLCFTLPSLLFMAYSGKFADSNKKKELLIGTDFINGLIMFIIGFLAANNCSINHLYPLMFLSSTVSVFFNPAIGASIPLLVKKESLTQANALMNITNQTSNILGPAVGGILISQFDVEWLFYINAISFIVSSMIETFLKIPDVKLEKNISYFLSFKMGWKVLSENSSILKLIFAGGFLINFFLAPVYIFITYICSEVLMVGSKGLGVADSVISVGAVIGALFLFWFSKIDKKKLAILGLTLEGVALVLGGIWGNYLSLLALTFILGLGISFASIGIGTLIQLATPLNYMGRVNSVSGAFSAVSVPVGSFVGSIIMDEFNVFYILIFYGVLIILSSLFFVNLKISSEEIKTKSLTTVE